MNLLVKICGLSTAPALEAALAAGADLVGFVFFPPSPRHVTLAQALALGEQAGARALKVGLTVDADDDLLAAIVEALRPDMLQLHGHETADRVRAVRARFGLPVMKALPIGTARDLACIGDYADAADRLLFDARPPPNAARPGGLGHPFDWRLLEGVVSPLPFMLSGGLHSRNIAEALRITQAPGVDISSGVERAPGEKDPDMITAFIRAARAAARAGDRTASPA